MNALQRRRTRTVRALGVIAAFLALAGPLAAVALEVAASPAAAAPNTSGGISQYYGLINLETVSDLLFNEDWISPDGQYVLVEAQTGGPDTFHLFHILTNADDVPYVASNTVLTSSQAVTAAIAQYGIKQPDTQNIPTPPPTPDCGNNEQTDENSSGTVVGTSRIGSEDNCGAFISTGTSNWTILDNSFGNANFFR